MKRQRSQSTFFKILTLFHAKNILYQIGEVIPILGSDRKDFKLDKEKGIMLPEKNIRGILSVQ